jgi:hypothetical protein
MGKFASPNRAEPIAEVTFADRLVTTRSLCRALPAGSRLARVFFYQFGHAEVMFPTRDIHWEYTTATGGSIEGFYWQLGAWGRARSLSLGCPYRARFVNKLHRTRLHIFDDGAYKFLSQY